MLEKDENGYFISTAKFSIPAKWSNEFKVAVAEFLIAYSQWEYQFELWHKDISGLTDKELIERLRDADGVTNQGKNAEKNNDVKRKMKLRAKEDRNYQNALEIIEDIEKRFSKERHQLIHGFHYIDNNEHKINWINKRDTEIGLVIKPDHYRKSAAELNKLVNLLNMIRSIIFGHTIEIEEENGCVTSSCTTGPSLTYSDFNLDNCFETSSTAMAKKKQ